MHAQLSVNVYVYSQLSIFPSECKLRRGKNYFAQCFIVPETSYIIGIQLPLDRISCNFSFCLDHFLRKD